MAEDQNKLLASYLNRRDFLTDLIESEGRSDRVVRQHAELKQIERRLKTAYKLRPPKAPTLPRKTADDKTVEEHLDDYARRQLLIAQRVLEGGSAARLVNANERTRQVLVEAGVDVEREAAQRIPDINAMVAARKKIADKLNRYRLVDLPDAPDPQERLEVNGRKVRAASLPTYIDNVTRELAQLQDQAANFEAKRQGAVEAAEAENYAKRLERIRPKIEAASRWADALGQASQAWEARQVEASPGRQSELFNARKTRVVDEALVERRERERLALEAFQETGLVELDRIEKRLEALGGARDFELDAVLADVDARLEFWADAVEAADANIGSAQGPFKYGLLARPYFPGSTQPDGEIVAADYRTAREKKNGREVHAVLEYDRRLTPEEIELYDLHVVDEPDPTEAADRPELVQKRELAVAMRDGAAQDVRELSEQILKKASTGVQQLQEAPDETGLDARTADILRRRGELLVDPTAAAEQRARRAELQDALAKVDRTLTRANINPEGLGAYTWLGSRRFPLVNRELLGRTTWSAENLPVKTRDPTTGEYKTANMTVKGSFGVSIEGSESAAGGDLFDRRYEMVHLPTGLIVKTGHHGRFPDPATGRIFGEWRLPIMQAEAERLDDYLDPYGRPRPGMGSRFTKELRDLQAEQTPGGHAVQLVGFDMWEFLEELDPTSFDDRPLAERGQLNDRDIAKAESIFEELFQRNEQFTDVTIDFLDREYSALMRSIAKDIDREFLGDRALDENGRLALNAGDTSAGMSTALMMYRTQGVDPFHEIWKGWEQRLDAIAENTRAYYDGDFQGRDTGRLVQLLKGLPDRPGSIDRYDQVLGLLRNRKANLIPDARLDRALDQEQARLETFTRTKGQAVQGMVERIAVMREIVAEQWEAWGPNVPDNTDLVEAFNELDGVLTAGPDRPGQRELVYHMALAGRPGREALDKLQRVLADIEGPAPVTEDLAKGIDGMLAAGRPIDVANTVEDELIQVREAVKGLGDRDARFGFIETEAAAIDVMQGFYPGPGAIALDGQDRFAPEANGIAPLVFNPGDTDLEGMETVERQVHLQAGQGLAARFHMMSIDHRQRLADVMTRSIIGRVTREQAVAELEDTLGRAEYDARRLFRDATLEYSRAVNSNRAEALGIEYFRYWGPLDGVTRPFCQRHVGKVYTRDEINAMNNGQTGRGSAMLAGGGYNCRHHWRGVKRRWYDDDHWYRLRPEDRPPEYGPEAPDVGNQTAAGALEVSHLDLPDFEDGTGPTSAMVQAYDATKDHPVMGPVVDSVLSPNPTFLAYHPATTLQEDTRRHVATAVDADVAGWNTIQNTFQGTLMAQGDRRGMANMTWFELDPSANLLHVDYKGVARPYRVPGGSADGQAEVEQRLNAASQVDGPGVDFGKAEFQRAWDYITGLEPVELTRYQQVIEAASTSNYTDPVIRRANQELFDARRPGSQGTFPNGLNRDYHPTANAALPTPPDDDEQPWFRCAQALVNGRVEHERVNEVVTGVADLAHRRAELLREATGLDAIIDRTGELGTVILNKDAVNPIATHNNPTVGELELGRWETDEDGRPAAVVHGQNLEPWEYESAIERSMSRLQELLGPSTGDTRAGLLDPVAARKAEKLLAAWRATAAASYRPDEKPLDAIGLPVDFADNAAGRDARDAANRMLGQIPRGLWGHGPKSVQELQRTWNELSWRPEKTVRNRRQVDQAEVADHVERAAGLGMGYRKLGPNGFTFDPARFPEYVDVEDPLELFRVAERKKDPEVAIAMAEAVKGQTLPWGELITDARATSAGLELEAADGRTTTIDPWNTTGERQGTIAAWAFQHAGMLNPNLVTVEIDRPDAKVWGADRDQVAVTIAAANGTRVTEGSMVSHPAQDDREVVRLVSPRRRLEPLGMFGQFVREADQQLKTTGSDEFKRRKGQIERTRRQLANILQDPAHPAHQELAAIDAAHAKGMQAAKAATGGNSIGLQNKADKAALDDTERLFASWAVDPPAWFDDLPDAPTMASAKAIDRETLRQQLVDAAELEVPTSETTREPAVSFQEYLTEQGFERVVQDDQVHAAVDSLVGTEFNLEAAGRLEVLVAQRDAVDAARTEWSRQVERGEIETVTRRRPLDVTTKGRVIDQATWLADVRAGVLAERYTVAEVDAVEPVVVDEDTRVLAKAAIDARPKGLGAFRLGDRAGDDLDTYQFETGLAELTAAERNALAEVSAADFRDLVRGDTVMAYRVIDHASTGTLEGYDFAARADGQGVQAILLDPRQAPRDAFLEPIELAADQLAYFNPENRRGATRADAELKAIPWAEAYKRAGRSVHPDMVGMIDQLHRDRLQAWREIEAGKDVTQPPNDRALTLDHRGWRDYPRQALELVGPGDQVAWFHRDTDQILPLDTDRDAFRSGPEGFDPVLAGQVDGLLESARRTLDFAPADRDAWNKFTTIQTIAETYTTGAGAGSFVPSNSEPPPELDGYVAAIAPARVPGGLGDHVWETTDGTMRIRGVWISDTDPDKGMSYTVQAWQPPTDPDLIDTPGAAEWKRVDNLMGPDLDAIRAKADKVHQDVRATDAGQALLRRYQDRYEQARQDGLVPQVEVDAATADDDYRERLIVNARARRINQVDANMAAENYVLVDVPLSAVETAYMPTGAAADMRGLETVDLDAPVLATLPVTTTSGIAPILVQDGHDRVAKARAQGATGIQVALPETQYKDWASSYFRQELPPMRAIYDDRLDSLRIIDGQGQYAKAFKDKVPVDVLMSPSDLRKWQRMIGKGALVPADQGAIAAARKANTTSDGVDSNLGIVGGKGFGTRSLDEFKFKVDTFSGRANYDPELVRIQWDRHAPDPDSVMLHEFGHAIEDRNRRQLQAAGEFLRRRIKPQGNLVMRNAREIQFEVRPTGHDSFKPSDYVYKAYLAKTAQDNSNLADRIQRNPEDRGVVFGATEVTSMAFTKLGDGPAALARLWREDPEHLAFLDATLRGEFGFYNPLEQAERLPERRAIPELVRRVQLRYLDALRAQGADLAATVRWARERWNEAGTEDLEAGLELYGLDVSPKTPHNMRQAILRYEEQQLQEAEP